MGYGGPAERRPKRREQQSRAIKGLNLVERLSKVAIHALGAFANLVRGPLG